jgi:hypothetical protein
VVSLAFSAMVAAGAGVPGAGLAKEIAGKLVCAVDLGACSDESALESAYGFEVAKMVSDHAPALEYEQGMFSLPIDYRECRDVACGQGVPSGEATQTNTGLPVTLFTHVIDCRDPGQPVPEDASCDELTAGFLYLQYWAYYPDSATTPFDEEIFARKGYHPDDWESFQVQIGPEWEAERASSHHGYNGTDGDPINDTGLIGGKTGWAEPTGRYWISSKSHAGRVGTDQEHYRWTNPEDIRLIPLEGLRDEWDDYEGSPDHTPAWLKDVYLDPENQGTD